MNTDVDAVVYLMLVNSTLHDLFPTCITIGAPAFPHDDCPRPLDLRRAPCVGCCWLFSLLGVG